MATRSPFSGPSTSTPRNATTAARKSLRRTAAYRRNDGDAHQPPHGVDDDRRQHGARQVREQPGGEQHEAEHHDRRGDTAHLGVGAGPRIGGRLRQRPADPHPTEEPGREVGGAVRHELLVVGVGVHRTAGREGPHGCQPLRDAHGGDGEAAGDDAAPQPDVDDGDGRDRDAGGHLADDAYALRGEVELDRRDDAADQHDAATTAPAAPGVSRRRGSPAR